MKKIIMGALAVTFVAGQAHAISRYESLSISCQRAQSIVAQEGAAIFRYPSERNPSLTLYDRYVANGNYCAHAETAVAGYIPTSNTNECPLLRCMQSTFDDDDFLRN